MGLSLRRVSQVPCCALRARLLPPASATGNAVIALIEAYKNLRDNDDGPGDNGPQCVPGLKVCSLQ